MNSLKKINEGKSKSLSGFSKFRKDWIEPFVIAFLIAAVIRIFIIAPFKIPSGSMEDTLLVGDHLMAVKFIYGIKLPFTKKFIKRFRDPKPGEIIIFKFPSDPSKDYIKRCIAIGGQTVEIRNKDVFVDGKHVNLPEHAKYLTMNKFSPSHASRDNYRPQIVPENHMFVMGDNRDNSNDSRFWGFVPYDNIKGKAFIIWWSWNRDVPLYDVIHRVRWSRFLSLIR